MQLRKTVNGNHVTLAVIGTVDTVSAPQLGEELNALDYSDLDLTLDFAETRYITSAGLRTLLIVRKKLTEDTMRIVNVSDEVADVFEMTGFSEILSFSRAVSAWDEQFRMSFKELLRQKLRTRGECTAFVWRGREYTWNDIDKASQIIAFELAGAGVKKGSHVGILAANSINWVFAFYAVQKLGGIAVLMNYGLKPAEVISLAEIGGVTHLCCGRLPGVKDRAAYMREVTCQGSPVVYTCDIGDDVDITARFGEYADIRDCFPEVFYADDAGVMIFTSGSTGKPKAVLSSAYNLLSCYVPIAREYRFSAADRNCAFLPMFHIFGFVTAISGGILCDYVSCIPEGSSPAVLLDTIESYQCTLFHSVPTMVLAMTQTPDFAPERVRSLRASVLGGSATTESQMNMLRRLFPNNHFGNVYGMSENAAITITGYGDTVQHTTQTVGKPLEGVEIELRDPVTGERVADGQQGEIYIRCRTMIICYYRLAIDKQPLDDEGWLRTGDLGVMQEDGYLRLVGRTKDLIIRGGENISPVEVADAIAELPAVADVRVLGVPHEVMGEQVAAAIILRDGADFDAEQAKAALSEKLAKYKIPEYFVICKSFPLLGSGKIDTITLKEQIVKGRKE